MRGLRQAVNAGESPATRGLHLLEKIQVTAAHRKVLWLTIGLDLGGFLLTACHFANGSMGRHLDARYPRHVHNQKAGCELALLAELEAGFHRCSGKLSSTRTPCG